MADGTADAEDEEEVESELDAEEGSFKFQLSVWIQPSPHYNRGSS